MNQQVWVGYLFKFRKLGLIYFCYLIICSKSIFYHTSFLLNGAYGMEKTHIILEKFMKTHTPSGFESEGQYSGRKRTKAFAEKVSSDVHEHDRQHKSKRPPHHAAGHCDEWFMSAYFGRRFIHFAASRHRPSVLAGKPVLFLTKTGSAGYRQKPYTCLKKKTARKRLT